MNDKEFDLSAHDTDGIEGAIRRHQEKGATDTALYRALLKERARRNSKFLDSEKTIALLIDAAKQGTFVTYKDVAAASGIDFSKVRYQVGKHLDGIIDTCYSRSWPLLTALCVKQSEARTGNLSGDSLKGFIAGVRRQKIAVTDPTQFLRDAQVACFEWAKTI